MKWIPLSERKPVEPLDENVIFCNSDGLITYFGSNKIPLRATHWLELPPIPKPEMSKDPEFQRLQNAMEFLNSNPPPDQVEKLQTELSLIYWFLRMKYGN